MNDLLARALAWLEGGLVGVNTDPEAARMATRQNDRYPIGSWAAGIRNIMNAPEALPEPDREIPRVLGGVAVQPRYTSPSVDGRPDFFAEAEACARLLCATTDRGAPVIRGESRYRLVWLLEKRIEQLTAEFDGSCPTSR